jgi:ATP-dependent DNA helicase RecQ
MTFHQLPTLDLAQPTLKQYFGYDAFRPGQQQIIQAAIKNQDVLVIMPTGGGKSLCFQLPSLLEAGLTIVVSPLIALMQDQVEALQDNGIGATFLNSTLRSTDVRDRAAQIHKGEIKLLYVAPERLLSEQFLVFLAQIHEHLGIARLAIDEAHCVSEWGHDFRPEYRQLKEIRSRFPDVPCMALTATATDRVRQDIIEQLELRSPFVHIASFNRQNLYYEVRQKNRNSYNELLKVIRKTKGSGIIYCLSRKRVDELTNRLQQDGIAALPYHAGMEDAHRTENQTRFIRDDIQVMVATIAFGMGINKPDVRFVVHYDLPRNLEGYYQESGRAGRDGEPAQCILYYSPADIKTIEWMIEQKVAPQTGEPLEQEQRIARQQLRQVVGYAESAICRRTVQLSYFGEAFPGSCGNCDNCLFPKPVEDWTIEAQKFLSCVARCKERFGMNYIIDVLRGSKDKRILENNHHQLSTYGIGKDRPTEEWRILGRSLLQQGLLDETSDGYGILRLNGLSWEVMRSQRSVQVALINRTTAVDAKTTSKLRAEAELLFDRLRALRKEIANEQSVPPYQVFGDSSLKLMAQQQPCTLEAFAQISGVGSYKLSQYGDRFVAVIRHFCEEQGISPPVRFKAAEPKFSQTSSKPDRWTTIPARRPTPARPTVSRTHFFTLDLHQNGYSPKEIAEKRDLRLSKVYEHLALLLEAGQAVYLDALVSPDRQTKIEQAIQTIGDSSLRMLRVYLGEQYLGEQYDEGEIRLVRANWRSKN